VSRRSRRAPGRISSRGFGLGDIQNRDTAMVGLNVSPVHGWHCICQRCARETREHA
jgi:hypothetical protein